MNRTCSVVINTYNRAGSLAATLTALRSLDYEHFEVVVVMGPCTDDTAEVVASLAPDAKLEHCARRNLSESRNIGIAAAAGEVVAFIDDDAYPDPSWLTDLLPVFDDPEVAATGGPVFGHTGVAFQARFNIADVFGNARAVDENPCELLNNPLGTHFPYPTGTNALFRREDLLSIGGFDEEFEYYLDETDVCRRLVASSRVVRMIETGFVYHKFLASDIRGDSRATRDFSTIMKNAVYFACKHGIPIAGRRATYAALMDNIARMESDVKWHLERGTHTADVYEQFLEDRDRSFDRGLDRHEAHEDLTRPRSWFDERQRPFQAFGRVSYSEPRQHICFVSETHDLAAQRRALRAAETGDVVRLLCRGGDWDTVDLEDGVWVHRLVVPPGSTFAPIVEQELDRIGAIRAVTRVVRD